MNRVILFTCLIAIGCFCCSASNDNFKSVDDSLELNIIFYGSIKKNERLFIRVQGQLKELKVTNSSRLDSLTFNISRQYPSSSIYVSREYYRFGIRFTKEYRIVPYGVKGKYLVIQQSYRLKRKYRFGHYWINNDRDLLQI